MSNRCERLRERALDDGLSSASGRAWRLHSRYCRDCRTDLFLLDSLDRQATGRRRHLGREEVAVLLRGVREQHRTRGSRPRLLTWSLRLACASLAVMVLVETRREGALERGSDAGAPSVRAVGAGAGGAGAGMTAAGGGDRQLAALASWPAGMHETDSQTRLFRVRRRIDRRRDEILKLVDEDQGGTGRHDVRCVSPSPVSSPA